MSPQVPVRMERVSHHMQLPLMTKNLALGCLLAGGLDDAWGGPYEGVAGPLVFEVPSRPALSDDAQLTLATCQSIVEFGRVDPENLASHLMRWFLVLLC
jgi:hypothetical protein